MGASSYERLGCSFPDVPSGGSAARAGLLYGSLSNGSSYSSSTHATAAPLPSFTGQTHFSPVWNGMSSDGVNISNRLLPPNEFASSDHSLLGEQEPLQQEGVSTGSQQLCEHYKRRCRVRFPCCTQFYPCHRCHNSSSSCKNDEAEACHATHLKCSLCQFEQEVSFCFPSLRVHFTVIGSLRNT